MPAHDSIYQYPDLKPFSADLFFDGESMQIQRCDETSPEDYYDYDAIGAIIKAASSGSRDALLALWLDGRRGRDLPEAFELFDLAYEKQREESACAPKSQSTRTNTAEPSPSRATTE